jgi:hypothetical protein
LSAISHNQGLAAGKTGEESISARIIKRSIGGAGGKPTYKAATKAK